MPDFSLLDTSPLFCQSTLASCAEFRFQSSPSPSSQLSSFPLELDDSDTMPFPGKKSRNGGSSKRKGLNNRQKRQQATVRERQRMRHLSRAFDQLRKVIPTYQSHASCTKIQTLRLAIEYIHDLSELLRDTNQPFSDLCWTTRDVALNPSHRPPRVHHHLPLAADFPSWQQGPPSAYASSSYELPWMTTEMPASLKFVLRSTGSSFPVDDCHSVGQEPWILTKNEVIIFPFLVFCSLVSENTKKWWSTPRFAFTRLPSDISWKG